MPMQTWRFSGFFFGSDDMLLKLIAKDPGVQTDSNDCLCAELTSVPSLLPKAPQHHFNAFLGCRGTSEHQMAASMCQNLVRHRRRFGLVQGNISRKQAEAWYANAL